MEEINMESVYKSLILIEAKNLILKNYPVRKFQSYRQEILEDLVKIRGIINPTTIFMPSSRSLHQDHQTI